MTIWSLDEKSGLLHIMQIISSPVSMIFFWRFFLGILEPKLVAGSSSESESPDIGAAFKEFFEFNAVEEAAETEFPEAGLAGEECTAFP